LLDSPDLIAHEIKGYCASGGKALLLNNFNSISLPNVPSVDIDDNHGARIATEHLLEKKCDKYLLCYKPEVREDGYIERRINGYSQVMQDAGLIPEIVKLSEIDSCLCQLHDSKIGVFCLTDSCGLKLIKMAEEAKWDIGNNFMIVGFDNLYLTEIIKPRLTTMHQPFEEMGRIAMNKIINMILFGIAEKSTTIVPSLIKGETT
jgi:LacI family transcriptional regulator